MGVGGEHHTSVTLWLGKARYPLYRSLGGPQTWSGWMQKISPLPRFDPRIIKPVVICYTN